MIPLCLELLARRQPRRLGQDDVLLVGQIGDKPRVLGQAMRV